MKNRFFGEQILATSQFCLNRLSLSGSLSIEAEVLMFTSVLSVGRYQWSVGEERGEAESTPFLLRPDTVTSAFMADAKVIALTVDPGNLQRTARMLYADDTLTVRFSSATPVNASYARFYRDLLVAAPSYIPFLPGSTILQTSFYRMAAASLLECFSLHGDPTPRRDSARSQRDGYKRAHAYIDDHASEPITLDDIAAAASMSTRQLNAAARTYSPSGASAAEELRRVRLAGAHQDLVDGDPSRGDTVREIALRWGFTPSHFARIYRAMYHVAPRYTLTR